VVYDESRLSSQKDGIVVVVDSHVKPGRRRQRNRSRRLLLEAAGRLMRQGVVPTVEDAAAEAEMSPATGYRYFPTQGALLNAAVEASFGGIPADLFSGGDTGSRIDSLIDRGFGNLVENELLDRAILRLALDQWLRQKRGHPLREERAQREGRKPLVEQILEPLNGRLSPRALARLRAALGMVLGIESYVVLNDIYSLSPAEISEIWRWACKAMVAQALEEAGDADSRS
jgi:AcrR family transcriptional regulator